MLHHRALWPHSWAIMGHSSLSCVCQHVCMYICMYEHHARLVATEVRRGHWPTPLKLELQMAVNPCPLQEQQPFLTAEPALKPQFYFETGYQVS